MDAGPARNRVLKRGDGEHRNRPRRIVGDGSGLSAARPVAGGGCLCLSCGTRRLADPRSLTSQLLETRVDRRKIVGSSRTSASATQFVEARADHRKIIGSSGSGHISSPLSLDQAFVPT